MAAYYQHEVDNQPQVVAIYPWECWSNAPSGGEIFSGLPIDNLLATCPCWRHSRYVVFLACRHGITFQKLYQVK